MNVVERLAQLQTKPTTKRDADDIVQKLAALQQGVPSVRYIRKRKNLSRTVEILSVALTKGIVPPGGIINTRNLVIALGEEVNILFDRQYERGDEDGPSRSLGDLIGGHGLCLRRVAPCKYLMPSKLPVVVSDHLIEEAVY